MSTKSKSIKVGIISLFTIFLIYFGMNFLKGINVLNNGKILYAYYEDVAGLTEGNAITVRGYKIGTITEIQFDQERENQLRVNLNIENNIGIPKNSVAKIVSLDLMGTKGISLVLGDSSEFVSSGDELKTSIESSLQDEVNAQILPLKMKTEELIGSIDSVMTVITSVLNKDARESLSKSLISLDQTFSTLSETMTVIDKMVNENKENVNVTLTNFASVSENLNHSNEEIKNILYNFSSISDSLVKADILTTVNKINMIVNSINNEEGSLGKLVKNKSIYENLEASTRELEELIKDIKLNPERYVNFSIISSPKPYVKPNSK
ncbi:MAG: hypothetical protein CMD02_00595 [Flavobacteriales bacterium]|nr:hypothetical protein [Flavobacteriales bacterium]|tara:strand:- start:1566 stop:2531 length:966 start_codon:yes stop_codon:yes gene_type:complete